MPEIVVDEYAVARRDAAFLRAARNAAAQVHGTVLVTLGGSFAYGTDRPGSDIDIMGIYVAPAREVMGLRPPPKTIKFHDRDVTFYEIHHWCSLAAKANPTVLEALAAPVLCSTRDGLAIRNAAPAFLSKLAHKTYGGYAVAQIRKAEAGTGGSRGVEHFKREKFLVHTLRLLHQGVLLLSTGRVQVRLSEEVVESIRATAREGLDAVKERADSMQAALDHAYEQSTLPDEPDYEAIADLICRLRGVT